jgi:hypothetical protein
MSAATATVPGEDEADEEVIDLLDVITIREADTAGSEAHDPVAMPEAPADTADEEAIDLLDVVTSPEAGAAGPEAHGPAAMPEAPADTADGDEPIIDLWETVEPQTAAVDANEEFTDLESRAQAVLTDATDAFDDTTTEEAAATAGPEDDVLVLEDERISETPIIPPSRTEQAETRVEEPPPAEESRDSAMFVSMAATEPPAAIEPVPLTEQQVEDALQRVIEKIYGEKIEHLLIRTIEKTVKREIEKIKNALLEDGDGMVE